MVASVHVVISCDVDPDRERFLDGVPPAASGRLTWCGVDEGIPALKESLRGLTDHEGREPVFTWFLRVDDQIRQVEGSYAWFAGSRAALIEALTSTGDELGWHPHFWRREASGGPWFQEIEDQAWQLDMLRGAHADYLKTLGFAPASVRMGWSYHSNETISQLDQLGVAVDLSGLPGYRTFDPTKTRSENLFDWYATPQAPYRPSRADYRRPALNGEPVLALLEVPSFVATSRLWSFIGGVQMARKTGAIARLTDAIARPSYCINVTAKPRYFAPMVHHLRRLLRSGSGGPLVFETHFHPDELVPNRSALYNRESVRANLESVVRACHDARVPLAFVPARSLPALGLA